MKRRKNLILALLFSILIIILGALLKINGVNHFLSNLLIIFGFLMEISSFGAIIYFWTKKEL